MKDSSIYFIEMEKRMVDIKNSDAYHAEISGTVASDDLFGRAENFCQDSLDWQQKLKTSSKAYTIAGVDIKEVVAKTFSITALAMSSYGEKASISDLINLKIKYTYSNLYHKTAEDLIEDCNYILGEIELYATPLADYKIDAAYKSNLIDISKKLQNLSKLPNEVIKQHSNDRTQYETLEKQIKKFYDKEMDPYMAIYEIADINLFLAYTAARKVRHHHLKRKPKDPDVTPTTGTLELLVLYKANLLPAVGVSLAVKDLNIDIKTDVDGETFNDALAPGTYHASLTLESYKVIEFDFTIVAGKTCAMQFLMEAV